MNKLPQELNKRQKAFIKSKDVIIRAYFKMFITLNQEKYFNYKQSGRKLLERKTFFKREITYDSQGSRRNKKIIVEDKSPAKKVQPLYDEFHYICEMDYEIVCEIYMKYPKSQ